MSYRLKIAEKDCLGVGKFKNAKGNTECAEFVRQATGAPQTRDWRPGVYVKDAAPGTIARGIAIATFDDASRYPTDNKGKHAAIYLSHSSHSITVLDQWNKQGQVKQRDIRFNREAHISRSDNGDTFYIIETDATRLAGMCPAPAAE